MRRHSSGYVIRQADRAADGYVLHHAECVHLDLDGKDFTLRTANPRHCCTSLRVLEHWCAQQTGSPPRAMWQLVQLIRGEAPFDQSESEARPAAVKVESIRTGRKPALISLRGATEGPSTLRSARAPSAESGQSC